MFDVPWSLIWIKLIFLEIVSTNYYFIKIVHPFGFLARVLEWSSNQLHKTTSLNPSYALKNLISHVDNLEAAKEMHLTLGAIIYGFLMSS